MAKVIFRKFVTKEVIYVRKTALVLLYVLVLSVSALGQYERTPVQLPEIGPVLGRLDKAAGWMQMPSGEWVERENKIPEYLSSDYYSLLDYEEHSLGIDNFDWLELRTIKINGEEYYLLIKACGGGQYEYPRIKKGWSYNYQADLYVFDKKDWKVELIDRKPQLLRVPLKCIAGLVYYFEGYREENYVQDMSGKINEALNEDNKGFTYYLNLNVLPVGEAVRFIFVEEYAYRKSSTFYGLRGTDRELPIKIKEIVTPKVFEKFYYETDLEAFRKLFP